MMVERFIHQTCRTSRTLHILLSIHQNAMLPCSTTSLVHQFAADDLQFRRRSASAGRGESTIFMADDFEVSHNLQFLRDLWYRGSGMPCTCLQFSNSWIHPSLSTCCLFM